ncbi:hypothetical protein [Chroococcidiopsis sp. SAG 2025]|uniref:hypothetical protein n=1 Tax=Chroococcidiopsis sp. SAG 2025 TaxID=171389 RepID=UPI0029372462|nr:hypothetical protein [Chroococcidiopsis sp. SAG 2025]
MRGRELSQLRDRISCHNMPQLVQIILFTDITRHFIQLKFYNTSTTSPVLTFPFRLGER